MTTIQRQYSLPNCTLALEGLNDTTAGTSLSETRPVMSMLLSAECRFAGQAQPIRGGRDFLNSLVKTVSLYAQEFLSGVQASKLRAGESIQLEASGLNVHRLTVRSEAEASEVAPKEVLLSTVQLFDLIEAVDQFLADTQTLPDLSLQLAPVSKRDVQIKHATSQQVVPATVGIASLAVAAIALFLIPIPQRIEQPPDTLPQSAITSGTQLRQLGQGLYATLQPAWRPSADLKTPLLYRVSVDLDGKILGYQGLDSTSQVSSQKTPLLNSVQLAKQGGTTPSQAIAQFKVTFQPGGSVEVAPWTDGKPTQKPASPTPTRPSTP
jgi:hypothetical protein